MSRRKLGPVRHVQPSVITTRGDIIRGSSVGKAERLAVGSAGTFVTSDGTDTSWGAITKEFFVYVAVKGTSFPYTIPIDDFITASITSTGTVKFLFHVPNDFTSLTNAVVVVIPDASETIQWDVATDFGASGEASNANSEIDANVTLGVTLSQIAECNVSPVLSGIAAGDFVGMEFLSDTSSIRPFMLRIRYT